MARGDVVLTAKLGAMSALGQKQTLRLASPMSALPPKADIRICCLRAATSGFGQGLLDLAGFPPHDGQTAVIKKRL
jgi:hypothetical protein